MWRGINLICRIGPQKRQITLLMKQIRLQKKQIERPLKRRVANGEEGRREYKGGGGGGGSPWRLRTPILVARENKPYFRPQNISRRPAKITKKSYRT
jgi:hypothetical protein